MKHFLILFYFLLTVSVACGQEQDICSHLRETGRVVIQQDERLTELVGASPKVYLAGAPKQDANNTALGYRIRIYSGNQQTVSKNRCYGIQANINETMPELTTYITFKSPNWRISAGDFRTSEEASAMLAQLRKAFPAYGKEMFIVKEKINLY